jgi:hypothetical protein
MVDSGNLAPRKYLDYNKIFCKNNPIFVEIHNFVIDYVLVLIFRKFIIIEVLKHLDL